jgi:hypothetical protein
MAGFRSRRRAMLLAAGLLLISLFAPISASASDPGNTDLKALLDGKPIPLDEVGKWYCEDFGYRVIHCFSDPKALETEVAPSLATASVTYVVVYEYPTFQGAYMYISDNYTVLGVIGWNDRVSSFSVRNSMSGWFWVDWFYGGTGWSFCCNSQVGSLGSFDNSFSSVFHN